MERLPAMAMAEQGRFASAEGKKVIATYGSPTLVMPDHVQEAVRDAAGRIFDRDTRGSLGLRTTIADYLSATHALAVDPQRELLITHGAMHGLSVTFRALFAPGDEVIIPAPTFFFDASIRSTGAIPVYVALREDNGWRWDLDEMAAALTPRTRALVVCNPNNPTSTVPTYEEVAALVAWASAQGLIVVADEAYARFVFDGARYTPQMTFRDLHPQLVTVTSLSKNYGFSNWRVAYVHAPEPLLTRIHRQFEWDALDVGPVPQAAAQAAISGPQDWIETVLATYQPNRDRLMRGLADAGLSCVRPAGGPFAFVNFSSWDVRGRELESVLMSRGLYCVAGDGFQGPDTHARVMFGGDAEAIDQVIHAFHQRGSHTS